MTFITNSEKMEKNSCGLDEGYSYEVDQIEKDAWHDVLSQFEDSTIYQTWSYGGVRWGAQNISHFVLKKNGDIVAIVQVRIIKIPVIGGGIAYIPWGPIWKKKDQLDNINNLKNALRALRYEYAINRKLYLRLKPNITEHEKIESVFQVEQYITKPSLYRTIILDLQKSQEELRQNLHREHRRLIKKAEANNLEIIQGTSDDLYQELMIPYNEMLERKKFTPGLNIEEFQKIQSQLPDQLKMNIIIAKQNGKTVASVLGSLIGEKGIFILGGSNREGLQSKASYLLPWKLLLWMKSSGAKLCDFGGYNPDKNPGTGHFKAGFGGIDIRHLGQFNSCISIISKLSMKFADLLSHQ